MAQGVLATANTTSVKLGWYVVVKSETNAHLYHLASHNNHN